jgi:hypothetical protein
MLTALALAGCSSSPRAASSSRAGVSPLPTGWMRYSYKALSVGVPAGWKISSALLLCSWPADTVDEFTVDNPIELAASCPAGGPSPAVVQSIAIECLTGRAGHLFSGPGPTTIVDRQVLHHSSPSLVYLQGDGWQAVVATAEPAPTSFTAKVLATVEPTGKPC